MPVAILALFFAILCGWLAFVAITADHPADAIMCGVIATGCTVVGIFEVLAHV